MLLAAVERLVDMPAVTSWFHHGTLSWGAVRAIVLATRNLTAAQRGWVDDCLVDHGVEGSDGDQVVSVVDGLVDRARADLARDRESSAVARRWLALQPRLDGTVDVHGTLDAATGATALATFHAMRDTCDDHDHHGDGEVSGDAVGRAPVELTPAAARLLACDATLRAVITDGPEILGVTAAHPKVSATVRAALTVRDGGCRFPTCTQPADLCDAHHIVPVASGGRPGSTTLPWCAAITITPSTTRTGR